MVFSAAPGSALRAPAPPLLLEQRVPFFSRIVRGSPRFAHQVHMSGRLKVIAVIGSVLVAHPLRLGFPALVVHRGVKEPAILATVKIGVALRAGVVLEYLLRREQLNRMPALKARESKIRHGWILARPQPPFDFAHHSAFAHDPEQRRTDGPESVEGKMVA